MSGEKKTTFIKCKGGCNQSFSEGVFELKSNGDRYKYCPDCREKKRGKCMERLVTTDPPLKKDIKHNTDSMSDKKKRETRPSISDEKKQIILKEQDNYCRGPAKGDCMYYECDMKINRKQFSDPKAVLPQYDHIKRWREGGNSIFNLQALCPNCHRMKTRVESLINEDPESLECPRIKGIYASLTKDKMKVETSSSSSEDEYDELFNSRRRNRSFKKNYYTYT